MEFLGQGGPNKTIHKVMGPEMKKIYIIICQSLSVRVSVRTLSPPTFMVRFEL